MVWVWFKLNQTKTKLICKQFDPLFGRLMGAYLIGLKQFGMVWSSLNQFGSVWVQFGQDVISLVSVWQKWPQTKPNQTSPTLPWRWRLCSPGLQWCLPRCAQAAPNLPELIALTPPWGPPPLQFVDHHSHRNGQQWWHVYTAPPWASPGSHRTVC